MLKCMAIFRKVISRMFGVFRSNLFCLHFLEQNLLELCFIPHIGYTSVNGE